MKIYNCFHDRGSTPPSRYISELRPALRCGCDVEFRKGDVIDIPCIMDNEGDNISAKNTQYSELTGYYWAWKNDKDSDIVGIEHYRRHFIKSDAKIDDYVNTEDLLTEEQIRDLLKDNDFILPVPQILANTSIYDLYVICFNKQADEIIHYMKQYFEETGKDNYLESMYHYMSHNKLYRANMLITTKPNFDKYCEEMFAMLFYMEKNMPVKADSRVWGYVSELYPMIYVRANNLKSVEAHVAIDDFNQDIQKDVVYSTQDNSQEPFDKDPKVQIEFFKTL